MATGPRGEVPVENFHPAETDHTDRYALLSVYDKVGIVDFALMLDQLGYRIISTGGTGKALSEVNIPFVPIQDITGNPESFEGRMKTISFQIEGGILFDRTKPQHVEEAQTLHVPKIDLVVCNLYPFEETLKKPGVTFADAVENIDVGGPTMVRAAAKNHKNVLVVIDPSDYDRVIEALKTGEVSHDLRQELAAKAFGHLAFYDAQVAKFLSEEQFPQELTIPLRRSGDLRYGDNPDQKAVWYAQPGVDTPLGHLVQLEGKGLSATNLEDIDAGIKAVRMFSEPAAVVVKHNTPCGIALGVTISEALDRAIIADSESAFGGVVILNMPMTVEASEIIAHFKESKGQMDVIAAPSFTDGVVDSLHSIRKRTGILSFGELQRYSPNKMFMRVLDGGMILQTENNPEDSFPSWKTVTERQPTEKQLELMRVAWKFLSRIRSNTVAVIDPDIPMTRGIGSGQTSRVLATKIALERAGDYTKGAILASDSFFPFDDSVKLAAEQGIVAIVQQGGSINDQASISAANDAGITMVFTGQRAFFHG